jgi:hypothetical protein
MCVKGRTSRTIEVAEATMMPSHILHGQPIPAECHEFEDLDYPNEDDGIEKLFDAKGTLILCPHKDIIVKTH